MDRAGTSSAARDWVQEGSCEHGCSSSQSVRPANAAQAENSCSARGTSPCRYRNLFSLFQFRHLVGRGSMNFVAHIWEVVALLAPDLLALSLVGGAFLSLYSIAGICGFHASTGMDSGLALAFALAYFVTVTANVASHLMTPAPSTIRTSSPLESQSAGRVRECPPERRRTESAKQEGTVTAL